MNLPSERSNLGVVIKTEAGVTVPGPPNPVHRTLDYTGLRAQAAILNRACDSRERTEDGGLVEAGGEAGWRGEPGKVDVPWRPETGFWKVRGDAESWREEGAGRICPMEHLPQGRTSPITALWTTPVVGLPGKGHNSPKVMHTGEEGQVEKTPRALPEGSWSSCPFCLCSGLLRFTSFVPQFPHL